MTQFKYSDSTQTVVFRTNEDGSSESHGISAQAVRDYLSSGNTILPPDPPVVDYAGQLAALDTKSIRALRAVIVAQAAGQPPNPQDISTLQSYEQQALTLRQGLAK